MKRGAGFAAVFGAALAAVAAGAEAPAVLTGRAKALPREGVSAKPAGGGGAYGDRSMRDAVRFDFDRPGPFVVNAVPLDGAVGAPAPGELRVDLRVSRGRLEVRPDRALVPVGGELVVRNRDRQDRNVFSGPQSAAGFNRFIAPGRETRVRINQTGPVHLRSLDDEFFEATLYAAGPHAVWTDDAGHYRLDLPPGRYRVEVWHPRLPMAVEELDLPAGATVERDFGLGIEGLPQVE